MDVDPYRASFYVQDKLEYKGFVAIAGLNLDVINPNGSWYVVEKYEDDFFSSNYTGSIEDTFEKVKLDPCLLYTSPSPRD